jgi:hypothetical protein
MRDIWFSDKIDLVKWSVLFNLAEKHQANHIIQVAYYRPSSFGKITIDNEEIDVPHEVIDFFRNINNIKKIKSKITVNVFCDEFNDRDVYKEAAINFIKKYHNEKCVIFLDPDTGLQSQHPQHTHVLNSEAHDIFDALKSEDIFVFYQHKTNQNNNPWIEPKRVQLAQALGLKHDKIKIAQGKGTGIAHDVVLFFIKKT